MRAPVVTLRSVSPSETGRGGPSLSPQLEFSGESGGGRGVFPRVNLDRSGGRRYERRPMNQHPGVIGRKLGMTQVFGEDGTVTACTVVEAATVVVAKRTVEKDGYSALVLGLGELPEKRANKPGAAFF